MSQCLEQEKPQAKTRQANRNQPMIHKKLNQLPFFTAGDKTELTEVIHPKNDPVSLPYSLAFAYLEPGTASLPHVLKGEETYIFTKGSGRISVGLIQHEIAAGSVICVPGDTTQFVENTGLERLEFYCIVSPPWSPEGEQML